MKHRIWIVPAYDGRHESSEVGAVIEQHIQDLIACPFIVVVEHRRLHGDESEIFTSADVSEMLENVDWFGDPGSTRGFILMIATENPELFQVQVDISRAIMRSTMNACHNRHMNVALHVQ